MLDNKVVRRSGGTSVFMLIAIIVFVLSMSVAVFSLLWKQILLKNQDTYREDLKKAEAQFDVVLIDKLRKVSAKIEIGERLLKNHMAVSEVLNTINLLTSEGIRFNSLEFSAPNEKSNEIQVVMKGVGKSFSAIAWQSDVFGKSMTYGNNKSLKNPVITDLLIDANGNVAFTFTANMDPADISYEKTLEPSVTGTTQ